MSNYKFCPQCAKTLVEAQKFGQLRQACPDPECGFVHFLDPKVAVVALVEQDDKLLLGQRDHNPGKGLWSFVGGFVDRGEKLEEAARREVKEETGLDVTLTGLLGVYSATGMTEVLVVYRAVLAHPGQALIPQPGEVAQLAFFDPAEMPHLAFDFDSQIYADWQKQTGQLAGSSVSIESI